MRKVPNSKSCIIAPGDRSYKLSDHLLIIRVHVLPGLVHSVHPCHPIKLVRSVPDKVDRDFPPQILFPPVEFQPLPGRELNIAKGELMLILLGNSRSGVLDITRAINTKPRRGRGHHKQRVVGRVGSKFFLVKQSQRSISNNPV